MISAGDDIFIQKEMLGTSNEENTKKKKKKKRIKNNKNNVYICVLYTLRAVYTTPNIFIHEKINNNKMFLKKNKNKTTTETV
jgi:hypothetical protein